MEMCKHEDRNFLKLIGITSITNCCRHHHCTHGIQTTKKNVKSHWYDEKNTKLSGDTKHWITK